MHDFGYPKKCKSCLKSEECLEKDIELRVHPYYRRGNHYRLMLIGQDPTIFIKKERVKSVLMLDEENGQLRKWLGQIFGADFLNNSTVYATNIVKCTFPKPPSTYRGKHFLKPYFKNCQVYLKKELLGFKPDLVLTFGEPSHRYFSSLLDNSEQIGETMQSAFGNNERFFRAQIDGFGFSYSPSLHIKTFRVAETYGKRIENFKKSVLNEIKSVESGKKII